MYLFEPCVLKNGLIKMKWRYRLPNGIMFNLVDYLGNQINNIKLV